MNCTHQQNIIIFQIFYCLRKGIIIFTFCINIFIAGNNPLCPAIGSFCMIHTFHTREIKAFVEILPRIK